MPYITMPHPFKKGDIVSIRFNDDRMLGLVSDDGIDRLENDMVARKKGLDGSDFVLRVEVIYKEKDGFSFGHEHVCPLYFEMYEGEIDYSVRNEISVLGIAKEILNGNHGRLSELLYFMRK